MAEGRQHRQPHRAIVLFAQSPEIIWDFIPADDGMRSPIIYNNPTSKLKLKTRNKMMGTLPRPAFLLILLCCGLCGLTQAQTISTFAGTGTAGTGGNGGAATSATITNPFISCTDPSGNFYFVENGINQLRKISAAGIISVFAGTGASGNTGDGGLATAATFNTIKGVCADPAGNIYICDNGNQRIRKVGTSGIVSHFAGSTTAASGFGGDGGPASAATLSNPFSPCSDAAGNIYIYDNANFRIRMVSAATGNISTICGNGTSGNTGNGGLATAANIGGGCYGMYVNPAGTTLWFAQASFNVVRKFTIGGNISLVAGNGSSTYSGDGGQATLAGFVYSTAVALDAQGNVYIADGNGNRVRKVDVATGIISTFCGNGTASSTGDGGAASSATVNLPYSISISPSNVLYISELFGSRIRKVQISPPLNGLAFSGGNNYVVSAANTGITGAQPRTVEMWVKFNASSLTSGVNNFLFSSGSFSGSAQGFGLYANNGALSISVGNFGVSTFYTLDAAWHHIALVYNGTSIVLYVDGSSVYTYTPGYSLPTANSMLYLGTSYGNSQYFGGTLDEVRLWNRALCAAEIQNNMNGELPAPTSQSSLLTYYTFDQGDPSGTNAGFTILSDGSGNGNNGTLTNFTLTGSTSNYVAGATAITGNAAQYAPAPTGVTETVTRTVSGTSSVAINSCNAIVSVTPNGTTPLSGSVVFKVTEDAGVQMTAVGNTPYVQRHYDIEPATNATTATANVTLYYTQAEFTAFNTARGTLPSLPINTADAAGYKANLRITQYHGTPTGANIPGNYPATWGGSGPAHKLITPTSVTYNSTASRWEVTFPVTGFSGFFASTNQTNPLPIRLESFSAKLVSSAVVLLSWQVDNGQEDALYTAERSGDGNVFTAIGNVTPGAASEYSLTDAGPLSGRNYYRLKVTGVDGRESYSEVRDVVISKGSYKSVYPSPARDYIVVESSEVNVSGVLTDMQGRALMRIGVKSGERINISSLASGIYILKLSNGASFRITKE